MRPVGSSLIVPPHSAEHGEKKHTPVISRFQHYVQYILILTALLPADSNYSTGWVAFYITLLINLSLSLLWHAQTKSSESDVSLGG